MTAVEHTTGPLILVALLIGSSGCGVNPAGPGHGPFGPPDESAILNPFAGNWTFDFEKTLDAQKAAGLSDEDVERVRKMYADEPHLGKMHPNISIKGNEAVCSGMLYSEYRFFAMHEHDDAVCGKAWHHEDRFDPGDMSKCYVRLNIHDNYLFLDVRMQEGLPDFYDPDLQAPVEQGSPGRCEANAPAGNDWSEWTTYVFSREE